MEPAMPLPFVLALALLLGRVATADPVDKTSLASRSRISSSGDLLMTDLGVIPLHSMLTGRISRATQ